MGGGASEITKILNELSAVMVLANAVYMKSEHARQAGGISELVGFFSALQQMGSPSHRARRAWQACDSPAEVPRSCGIWPC
jgi:hypothetical protein